jgi:hypothetical protein
MLGAMRKLIVASLTASTLAWPEAGARAQVHVQVTAPSVTVTPPTVVVPPPPSVTFAAPPPLVVVQPGVQVVPDYDEEVYFVDNVYWVRRGRFWYRSNDYHGGWVAVQGPAPRALVRIKPGKYRRWHPRTATVVAPPPPGRRTVVVGPPPPQPGVVVVAPGRGNGRGQGNGNGRGRGRNKHDD